MDAGNVIFNFKGETKDLEKTTSNIGDIIKGSLAAKGISKAISTINSSLDGAIDRVDTLNNFPNVMANFGIGAKESSKAINKLSDKLTGLPTTLDSAVSAVQRFTSKNNDIEKSTDIFLAVNNAIISGGASMEIQASALEQLSQAYSKGKPDMEEWRSMQMAMPGQLNQVAKAFGMTSDEMGQALREGNLSMDDFIDKIAELNKKGIDGFASFEEQARSSTGGLKTSITNMHTAVTRGTANMIQSINEALKNNDMPTISDMIQQASSKISDAFKLMNETIKNVPLKDILSTAKKLAPAITMVATAWGAWKLGTKIQKMVTGFQEAKLALKLYEYQVGASKIAQGAFDGTLKASEVVVGLLTGKIKLAQLATAGLSKAQAVLNAVMSANPVGLVITAIALLVAGFIYLWNNCEGFRKFWKGLWKGIVKVFNSVVDSIKIGIDKMGEFFTKTIPDTLNNLKTSFTNKITAIKDTIVNFFTVSIPNAIKNLPYTIGYFLGASVAIINNKINSAIEFVKKLPSTINQLNTEMWNNIIMFFSNLWLSITTHMNNIRLEIQKTFDNIVETVKGLPNRIWTWLVATVIKVGIWIAEMKSKASNGIDDVVKNIVNGFKNLPKNMYNIGKNIINGLIDGMKSMVNGAKKVIKDIGKGIKAGFTDFFQIHSPSRVFAWIGEMNMAGLNKGMEDMQPKVQQAIDGMFDLSPSLYGSTSTNLSPVINVTNINNIKQDPLGQMVNDIKTFAGGSKNDYNYGMGV